MTEGPNDEGIPEIGDVDWGAFEGQLNDIPASDEAIPPNMISVDMLAKRLLWDVAPCTIATEVAALLGQQPASEDVEEMEHEQSHQRLAAAALATPFIGEMARHAAAAAVGTVVLSTGVDIPPEELASAIDKLIPMIYQTSWSILAELVDIGVVHMPHYQWVTVTPEESGQ